MEIAKRTLDYFRQYYCRGVKLPEDFSPKDVAIAVTDIQRHNLVARYLLVPKDFARAPAKFFCHPDWPNTFDPDYDVAARYEDVESGRIGQVFGVDVYTDARLDDAARFVKEPVVLAYRYEWSGEPTSIVN